MISYATKDDINAIKELFDECFDEDIAFNHWFFDNIFDYKNTIVYKKSNKIVAMLQAMPYRISNIGEVSYIYGACTKKEYRGCGIMSELINFSFQEDKSNGKIASVLIPANEGLFDFYSRFGYEKGFFVEEKTEMGFKLEGDFYLSEISTDNAKDMLQIYNSNLKNNYYIERTEDYFKLQIKMFNSFNSAVYALKNKNNIFGYCFLNNDEIPFVQEIMTIENNKYLKAFTALLFDKLGKERIKLVTYNGNIPFGCIKWHKKIETKKGYMNLMFN